jgi:hypothetical protein
MRQFRAGLLLSFTTWALLFFWLGGKSEPFWRGYSFSGSHDDYYNLLVEGFLKGQVSMNKAVDPGLLSSDPIMRQKAAYLIDAGLYHGKYYLYYGVTPAALLLYPYALITHREMGLEVACLFFVLVGLGVSAFWLDRMRGWCRADWGSGFAVVAVSVLAAVPATTFLVRRASVYDLPIAAEYACACGLWVALFHAWRAKRPYGWLAAASVFFGLCVGCRPNMILLGPLVLIFAWLRTRGTDLSAKRAYLAAVVPAFLIGCGLGWYNAARFGNPLDFGFSHGLNWVFSNGKPLVSPGFIPVNASWYLFSPPVVTPRFPFDFPIVGFPAPANYSYAEALVGFFPFTLVVSWVLLGVLWARKVGNGAKGLSVPLGTLLIAAALMELVFTCLWGIRAYRYGVDFFTPVAFLLVVAMGAQWSRRGWRASAFNAVTALLVAVGSAHAVFGSVQINDLFKAERPSEFAWLSSKLNPTQETMQWLGADRPGPLTIKVRFHKPASPVEVAIVTTGMPGAYDRFRAGVFPNGYLSLGIHRTAFEGPHSDLFPIEWEKSYTIRVSMGSLYPDASDPYFKGWTGASVNRVKTLVWASLDDRSVLYTDMSSNPGTPGPRLAGERVWNQRWHDPERVVSVDSVTRDETWPSEILTPARGMLAVYSLQFQLGAAKDSSPMPLLNSGIAGNGNLLLLEPRPSGRFRLSVDEWGYGLLSGPEFGSTEGRLSSFQIVVGPALAQQAAAQKILTAAEIRTLKDRILVWNDGELVGNFQLRHHLEVFRPLVLGKNDAGFSSASAEFNSAITERPMSDLEIQKLLERALQAVGSR